MVPDGYALTFHKLLKNPQPDSPQFNCPILKCAVLEPRYSLLRYAYLLVEAFELAIAIEIN